jgi:hypothetical protein
MPGLVPGIHALHRLSVVKAWMAGTSPAMTMKMYSLDINQVKDYIPLAVSIEGASRGVRVAGNGRRLRAWFAARHRGGVGAPPGGTRTACRELG